ncbi:response regulator transcription factor [Ancylomarina salipaludis]|uniref:Response regulator transcription factor n=1 Tax=Ancylomarina salipaludis TaxID=2501299 RepID=A0A4Q1JMM0_9BACT|nr:response regulator transcription factor [Ancylomarina salipaludis]RXQ95782.1 response regulator transcription factor [Ancylomarina salipaludis]
MEKIKIVLVDDHKIFRDGFRLLLQSFPYVEIIGEASNGQEFLDLLKIQVPEIVFMDINMPQVDGVEASRRAVEQFPDIKIIALTTFLDEDYLEQMLMAGVEAYMLKNSELDEFEKAIMKVHTGGNYFSGEIVSLLSDKLNRFRKRKKEQAVLPVFTEREKEIIDLICKGYGNKEIAEKTFLSTKTVEKHKSSLFQKTNTFNTVNLVIYAFKNQIVNP